LAVVIGRPCRKVRAEDAQGVIHGYTCGNDVTARDFQQADGQWTRAKGHDSFCPLGPWVETDLDVSAVGVRCFVDGEVRQDGSTKDLLHDVPAVIEWISAFMTLLPGDVILTGTPAGVGPLAPGNAVTVLVDGIGPLTNPVVAR
jgi:2-keto-4-pentenoate hydratase/2-oxohepta-3-ene-1,7-dioic acid hydratase in catechol pathway